MRSARQIDKTNPILSRDYSTAPATKRTQIDPISFTPFTSLYSLK